MLKRGPPDSTKLQLARVFIHCPAAGEDRSCALQCRLRRQRQATQHVERLVALGMLMEINHGRRPRPFIARGIMAAAEGQAWAVALSYTVSRRPEWAVRRTVSSDKPSTGRRRC